MRLAIIRNDVIVNVIEAPEGFEVPERGVETMPAGDMGPGWYRTGPDGEWTEPAPPETKRPDPLADPVYRAIFAVAKLSRPNMTEDEFRTLL